MLDPRTRAWCLGATAACLLPLLLQLPATLALAIAAIGTAGVALARHRALPTVARLALALLLVALVVATMRFSFGRDTGCALLAAMLAVKPTETFRLRDARSLVGFALFAPFATFLLDQGPLSLVLGVFAVLLALAAIQRLAELDSGDPDPVAPARRLVGVGRIVALGLPFALAAFWLFPRLAAPLWGVPERALARPGLSGEMSPGQWLDLMNDDTPALRARFLGAVPAMEQMYWRGPVLWDYDGRTWTESQWLQNLPPAPVRSGTPTWDYEIALEATDRRQLVALDLPVDAPAGTRLSHGHELHVRRPLASLTRWRLQSAPPLAYEPALKDTLRRVALRLPAGFDPRTHALARDLRAEAGGDDAAIVRRALDWIRSDFGYTLETPLPGRHAVDEFLFDVQAGYCEHFSSSFVVLMRAAGIPARVVTGYAGGYRNPIGGYWLVRRSDAHAWAEVWLAGSGWTRVDPTAAVAPERIYDTLDDRAPGAAFGEFAPAVDMADWLRRGWNDFVLGFDASRQQSMFQPLGLETTPWRLVALFVAMAGLALALTAWLVARRERERDAVLRAWHLLGRRYARIGLARRPDEPALAWAARVAAARDDRADTLLALSRRFARWRYAAGQGDPRVAHALARDLRAHRPLTLENAMRRLTLSIALASAVLAGCATVPAPLQGQYGNVSPRETANAGQHGVPVRWGGRIVSTEPMANQTCFEIVSTRLDASGRPRWATDATGGRFIACRAGFYDPAIFQPDREVTVTGLVDGQETRRIGEYDYRLPRVQANVVYLWPVREHVDVVRHPTPSPWWWW